MNAIYRKKNKIILILIGFFLLNFLFVNLSSLAYADSDDFRDHTGDDGEKPNILIRVLTWGFRFINNLVYKLLDNEGLSIDSLVFKKMPAEGKGEFIGLTLFKPGDAQDFIATFYNIFLYIAIAMFIPIFYSIGIHFGKAGDNPQEKSILKDKLARVVMTFIFIYSMPELLTVLVKVSDAFTGIFRSAGAQFLGVENTTAIVGQYIEGNKGSILETITGLMLIGINLWIIVFYIIRDLTIAFLFMLFPIIAIWYPMNTGMVKNWWREMAGNIFAQPIQAMILSMVLALGSAFGMGGAKTLSAGIYTLVAFGSIIPLTSIVKGFLGLETGIGAGRSMAGMGALFGTMRLANMTKRGMKEQTGKIKEGMGTLAENNIKKTQIEKNIEPSNSDVSVTLGNSNASAVDNVLSSSQTKSDALEDIAKQNRTAKKQLVKGVGGAAAGTFAGLTGATMMAGVGSRESIAMGSAGFALGRKIGDTGAGLTYSGVDAINQHGYMADEVASIQEDIMVGDISNVREMQIEELQNSSDFKALNPTKQTEKIQQLRGNQEFSRNEMIGMKKSSPKTYNAYRTKAENRYLGLENEKLDGTDFQNQERAAMMKQKKWEATGTEGFAAFMADKSYANLTPERKSPEELRTVDNAYLYQDRNHSVVYTQNSEGEVGDILHLGMGDPNLATPIDSPVTYTTEEIEIPQSEMYKINEKVKSETSNYMTNTYSHLNEDTLEYRQAYNQRERYNKELYTNEYRNNIKRTRQNIGASNLNFRNDETFMRKEEIRIQREELDKLRQEAAESTYAEDFAGEINPNLDSLQ